MAVQGSVKIEPNIKAEEGERELRLIDKLPGKKYGFWESPEIEIENEKNFQTLTRAVIDRAEYLLQDIDRLSRHEKGSKIRQFTIGKTFAPKYKNKTRWKVDGISNRWKMTYEDRGYDFLLAFLILTRNNISEGANEPFNNQQMLALALENQLIQHFAFVKEDPRLGNTSLESGKRSADYAGQVLYIAVRYTKKEEDEDDEDDDEIIKGKVPDNVRDQNKEKVRPPLIHKLPAEFYKFLDSCNIGDESDVENLYKIVTDRAKWLIEDIDSILRCEKNDGSKIRKFAIGETYARLKACKKGNEMSWTTDGMKEVWERSDKRMEKQGYNRLLGFAVITAENIPKSCGRRSFLNYFKNAISKHFDEDSRFSPANADLEYESSYDMGSVIYLAVAIIPSLIDSIPGPSFCRLLDSCFIFDQNSSEDLFRVVAEKGQWLIEDIDNILRRESRWKSHKIYRFWAGKIYGELESKAGKKGITLKTDGIEKIWSCYCPSNIMLGFAVLTTGNVRENERAEGMSVEDLAEKALERVSENFANDRRFYGKIPLQYDTKNPAKGRVIVLIVRIIHPQIEELLTRRGLPQTAILSDSCSINGINSEQLCRIVAEKAQWLIEDIDNSLERPRLGVNSFAHIQVKSFAVGRTYAGFEFKNGEKVWNEDGMKHMQRRPYLILLGFAVLTTENLPGNQEAEGFSVNNLAKTVLEHVVNHLVKEKKDKRFHAENRFELDSENPQQGQVIFLAAELKAEIATSSSQKILSKAKSSS